MTGYEQQLQGNAKQTKTAPTFSLDLAQHYFITKHFTLRLDVKNRLHQEEIIDSRTKARISTPWQYTSVIMFGVTYYF